MGFALNFSEKISQQEKSVFLCIKTCTFAVTTKLKPHLTLRFPQMSIIHATQSNF